MIRRYIYMDGHIDIEIHCGCCGIFFVAPLGGTCFCKGCREGTHMECKVLEIMGVRP